MTRLIILLLLCTASRVWAAACAESPTGQSNCEVFSARDQNALPTPLPNYLKLLDNNAAGIAVPTPAAGECIIGDTTATSSTDAYTITCNNGLTIGPAGNVVQQKVVAVATQTPDIVQWQNASATPLAGITSGGKVYATGMNIPRPYGTYYTITPIPTPASTTAAYAIAFDGEAESGLVHPYLADNSKVQIVDAGTYMIEVSAIVDLVAAPAGHMDLWLAVDGVNVPYSNTKVEIPNASTEFTLAVPLQYTFAAGSYFQIMYAVDDVDVQLRQVPATPSRTPAIPDAPAIIISVFKVSGN